MYQRKHSRGNFFLNYSLLSIALTTVLFTGSTFAENIVHDGEFNFLKAQYEKVWAEQDNRVDARLAKIREMQGGDRPNILYILVDDVGFGDFGIPELNYVRG